jgi:hypothetical protein
MEPQATKSKNVTNITNDYRIVNPEAQIILNKFHTDAPYFIMKGIPTVIICPGNENLAHVGVSDEDAYHPWKYTLERIPKVELMKALLIYSAILWATRGNEDRSGTGSNSDESYTKCFGGTTSARAAVL